MKFFRWAVLQNSWLWFHMLAGGILAKILMIWLPGGTIFAIILFSAVAWEVLEYFFSDVEKIYGSRQRFFADAVGDGVGALVIGGLLVF